MFRRVTSRTVGVFVAAGSSRGVADPVECIEHQVPFQRLPAERVHRLQRDDLGPVRGGQQERRGDVVRSGDHRPKNGECPYVRSVAPLVSLF